jgi:prephenate dehydrogenase
MDGFEIGIIGGTGGIGKWFADFFRGAGHPVHVTGRKTGLALPDLVQRCRAVFVSVPIGATIETIRRVGPLMKEDALLADFTSLKTGPVRAMLESSVSEVVGTHPLFGPDVPSLAGQNIILCPARGSAWASWLKEICTRGGAVVTEASPEAHDRKMAAVQVLAHLGTITLGLTLKELGEDFAGLGKFSTPIFRQRLRMIEKVFEHPQLYEEIIRENPASPEVMALYRKVLSEVMESLDREPGGLERELAGALAVLKKTV